jgi:hypothetical protein
LRARSPRLSHTAYPVRVPRPACSFHAAFRPHLAVTPWRCPCPAAPRPPGQETCTPEHDRMHGTHARGELLGKSASFFPVSSTALLGRVWHRRTPRNPARVFLPLPLCGAARRPLCRASGAALRVWGDTPAPPGSATRATGRSPRLVSSDSGGHGTPGRLGGPPMVPLAFQHGADLWRSPQPVATAGAHGRHPPPNAGGHSEPTARGDGQTWSRAVGLVCHHRAPAPSPPMIPAPRRRSRRVSRVSEEDLPR